MAPGHFPVWSAAAPRKCGPDAFLIVSPRLDLVMPRDHGTMTLREVIEWFGAQRSREARRTVLAGAVSHMGNTCRSCRRAGDEAPGPWPTPRHTAHGRVTAERVARARNVEAVDLATSVRADFQTLEKNHRRPIIRAARNTWLHQMFSARLAAS